MADELEERRKFKRVKLSVPVTLKIRGAQKIHTGITVDISAGGMAVLLDSFLPLGKNLLISFKIQEGYVFEDITTKILRSQDVEDKFLFGIEFLNMSQSDVKKINDLISYIYFIKKIKLFSSITHEEAIYLKNIGKEVNYSEGDVIFKEGEEGDAFYAVVSGKVKITKKSQIEEANEEVLALIREGEFFGEMALFDEGQRTANAIAHTNSTLFVITVDVFNMIIRENQKLAIKILVEFIRTLSKRLKTMNQEMVDLLFTEAYLTDYKKK